RTDGTATPAAGTLLVSPVPLAAPAIPGRLNPANSPYVVETLRRACAGCLRGEFDAMRTAPVHKGGINDAGMAFSGHTEFLAAETASRQPVMLLVAGGLRVALATTHLPLSAVPAAIDRPLIESVAGILDADLRRLFGIPAPRIVILGLNPHAGESGHLG